MSLALREWHVVTEAIARGDQLLTFVPDGDARATVGGAFWLVPTWEHQRPAAIKRSWHGELSRSNRDRPAGGGTALRCHAMVDSVHAIAATQPLDALDPWHLWTTQYAEAQRPATVLVLRASALVEPVAVAVTVADDAPAWFDLDGAAPPLTALVPALMDQAFAIRAAAVLAALGVDARATA